MIELEIGYENSIRHIIHIRIVHTGIVVAVVVVVIVVGGGGSDVICHICIDGTIDCARIVIGIRFHFQFDIVDVVELMIGQHGPDATVSHIGDAGVLACR